MDPRVCSLEGSFKDLERASHIDVVLPSKKGFMLRGVIYSPRGINYPVIYTNQMLSLLEKHTIYLSHSKGWVGWELNKSFVCANDNELKTVNGPVVVRLTTSRFPGTISTKNRSSLAAYHRTQYVPP
jgi:hypothetical protein